MKNNGSTLKFKKISVLDESVFKRHTKNHEPYADYIYSNFYSWDTEGINAVTECNSNLTLLISDYVDGRPFISFLGTKKPATTAKKLLIYAREMGYDPELKLIPQFLATKLKSTKSLKVEEDEASHDYIFSIPKLAKLEGKTYKNKRKAANKCEKTYKVDVREYPVNDKTSKMILGYLKNWESSKKSLNKSVDLAYEEMAIKRMLKISKNDKNVIVTVAEIKDEVVGFSIDEIVPRKYVLSHYFKTLPEYSGLTELLNKKVAQILMSKGGKHWNWQQDLGMENLRAMKNGYKPTKLLKKYTVSLK